MVEQLGGKCPIWGTPATVYPPSDTWVTVDSPRAGGRYRIAIGYGIGGPQGVQESVRARLTTWLVDQRRMGEPNPLATHEVILAAGAAARLRATAKVERFFLALNDVQFDPVGQFQLSGNLDDNYRYWTNVFGAWTEVDHPQGGLAVTQLLTDREWIVHAGAGHYRLTASGVDELEKHVDGRLQFDQGFVAMWFGDELSQIYDDGFAPAIKAAGYRPMRIDRKEHNNKIDDEIIAEIRRSRFVIADMTCPIHEIDGELTAVARGGVYYEAGFAHGLTIPVIWTAREGMADHLHFDTRQYAHIIWKDAADLREKLRVRIGAVLGYGPHAQPGGAE